MPHPSSHPASTGRGVSASVVASVLFGFVYFVPALVSELTEWEAVSWRIIITVPFMALLFFLVRAWPDVAAALAKLRARPALVLVLLANAAMLGMQLWLFAWAPQTGHGLEVALGYLLMPLVMVLLGVVLHRERLGVLRAVAVAAAMFGVGAALLGAGGLSWSTVAVALGYPIYFTVRRAFGVDTAGAMWLELMVLLPACVWFAAGPGSRLADGEGLPWGILVAFGAVSALALTLYIVASRLLSFSLFGLLSYVEPIVLVLVALVLLREAIDPSEYAVYAGIGTAVVLLMVEGAVTARAARRDDGLAA